jgi:hypothetical protein
MRTTTTPPLSPSHVGTVYQDDTVYLVLDDFGKFGQAYRETDPTQADRQTVVANLLSGQYERPLRIVAFNTAEGWARDVTAEIAQQALARADHDLSPAVRDFVERTA